MTRWRWRQDREEHIHIHLPEIQTRLVAIEERVIGHLKQGVDIMAALDIVRAEIAAAKGKLTALGSTVTEISTDLDDLITRLANGTPGSQEVIDAEAEAKALTAQLDEIGAAASSVAAKHTPPTP